MSIRGKLPLLAAFLVAAGLAVAAGPADFGMDELRSAIASRSLRTKVTTELSLDQPETYRIELYASTVRISGGDMRGLMYGLLDAASQIRASGKVKAKSGKPANRMRGVRAVIAEEDLDSPWFNSQSFWTGYMQSLAKNWMNRLVLSPGVIRDQDVKTVQMISQTATQYGVDFGLAVSNPSGPPAALQDTLDQWLALCPQIRALQLDALTPAEFWPPLFESVRAAGRRVTLEIRNAQRLQPAGGQPDLLSAGDEAEIALRVSSPFECATLEECTARINANPRTHEFFWEIGPSTWTSDPSAVIAVLNSLDAGYDVAVPRDPEGKPSIPDQTLWLWGRVGYDASLALAK